MAQADDDQPPSDEAPARQGRWLRWLAVIAGLIALTIVALWFSRERIVGNVIAGQLKAVGMGEYERISIAELDLSSPTLRRQR